MAEKEEYYRRKSNQRAANEKKIAESWRAKVKDPVTLFTAILAVCTLLLVIVGGLQYCALQQSDETNRVGLRPYISGVGLTVDSERDPLGWVVDVLLENSGGTPPLQLRYVIRSSADFSLDPEEIYQRPANTDAFSEPAIAPKGQIRANAGMPLAAFINSGRTWFISGAIHYRDEFSGTPVHIAKFCYALVAAKNYKTNTTRPGYDACPYWNCIGEKACADDRARYDKAVRDGHIRPTKKTTDEPEIPVGTALPTPYGMIIKVK